MGRRKRDRYPRLHSERKYKEPYHPQANCLPCAQLGKGDEPAVTNVRVEFTYMRGEDENTRVCAEHRAELLDLLKHKHKPWPKHFQGDEVWS